MWVHYFAIATAIATYLLILVGGLVHGTGSSLACPDWPTCYGTMMPHMEGGVLVEHSHRLAAGTVVVLTLALAVMLATSATPEQRRLRPFGWLAVALVFAQALLGGITVLLRLPTPVSSALGAPAPSLPGGATVLAILSAVSVYFQMVLGGLVRHSGAALACTDVPLCRGAIWPSAHPTVLIHVMHRLNALVV